jgi:hypothetical protein
VRRWYCREIVKTKNNTYEISIIQFIIIAEEGIYFLLLLIYIKAIPEL